MAIARERLRAQLQSELDSLHLEAQSGDMEPEELRARVEGILRRYLGGVPSDVRESMDDMLTEYASLRDAAERARLVSALFGRFR